MSAVPVSAGRMRLAEIPPSACASCGGQYTDRRHVDFGAAWEGPVMNQLDVVVEGATPLTIDDLIVCEECVKTAVAVLALADVGAPEMQNLLERVDGLEAMNANQAKYISQLEGAVADKEAVRRARQQVKK